MMVSIGEVLIDFIALQEGRLREVRSFERHPGGAPANVAVGLSRLGVESALVSKVGDDPFGDFLLEELRNEGVRTYIPRDGERHTGVVFVQLIGAKPEFILYDGVAYFNLKPGDVDFSVLENAEVVHFGTVLLAREPSRSTLFGILRKLKGKVMLSYDVNLRPDLWRGRNGEMLRDVEEALRLADVVKLGDGELEYLRGNGIEPENFNPWLMAVTSGERGSELVGECCRVRVPAYRVEPLDTTGAGDAFMAALLAGLYHSNLLGKMELDEESLRRIGRFANLVAALSTTRRGAWSVPKMEEIILMREVRGLYQRSSR
ncbi:carbohydrate kinase family protein [Thermococcus celer]|uniref:Sugar kinase n=1 Tax=Thermococcus celer Vu 13 = JCM 8558 TaxID=1293037 RepID=A0A218P2D2_THECE|nr:carbohydrate kinase [Thermococcus celer]ASI99074.1 sugar kinase [Thermococcus celer] [Thermococcus celer Vu 13 = JCM 8558]